MPKPTATVRVNLSERSYDIQIGRGLLPDLAGFLTERRPTSHVVVITDDNVDPLHADRISDLLVDAGLEVNVMVIDAGEPSKAAEVAIELWETMLQEGADRESVVLAVGGGVVGDLAGFVAATYTRGLPFFQVPTTLLAQVDSSVGGKVGINLPGAKNMVGAFWQPHGVLIDIDVLSTLPDREYRAGLAEVVKYGVIMDTEFFERLENSVDRLNARDPDLLIEIVARSCQLKADVVEADEREESGRRAILNYGHTFGHALEAATGYTSLLHGEGVAIGMACASRLAESLGKLDAASVRRQVTLLKGLGLPTTVPNNLATADLIKLMWRDKKVQGGQLRFVLPTEIGNVELFQDIPESAIATAMAQPS
jgi:3-dehydroquinate synthase